MTDIVIQLEREATRLEDSPVLGDDVISSVLRRGADRIRELESAIREIEETSDTADVLFVDALVNARKILHKKEEQEDGTISHERQGALEASNRG